jgi:L-lactate dehydrogenase complex protein LldG
MFLSIVSRFVERFVEQGGLVERVRGLGETISRVAEEARRLQAALAVASCDPGLVEALERELDGVVELFPPRSPLQLIERAGAGLTFPVAGVAETGSLVEICYDDADRLVSALPSTHFAYLKSSSIVPTLLDVAGTIRRASQKGPFSVTLISGPSRTADIELTIVRGVHGPHTVRLFLEV